MIFVFSKISLIYIKYFKLIYNLNKTMNNNSMLCKFNYSSNLIQHTGWFYYILQFMDMINKKIQE